MLYRVLLLCVVTCGTLGCSYDPYRPYRDGVGYSEAQIGPSTWRIFYEGPRNMSFGRSVELAKLRAAEIAVREGMPYFSIVEGSTIARTETDVERDFYGPYRRRDAFGYYRYPAPYYDRYVEVYERPTGVLDVRLYDEPGEERFDARSVLRRAASEGVITEPTTQPS